MKVTTDTKPLKVALTNLSTVVPRRSTIHALKYVKIARTDKQAINIAGTDLELWADLDLPGHIKESTESEIILVNLQRFRDALRPIKESTVELESTNTALIIGRTTLPLLDPKEYPSCPEIGSDISQNLVWPANEGCSALKQALVACDFDSPHCYVHVDGSKICATDGHRLQVVDNPTLNEDPSFLVPMQMAQLVARVVIGEVCWIVAGDRLLAITGTWSIQATIPDKTYPEYEKVIPKDNHQSLSCNRRQLLEALQAILPFTDKRSRTVQIDIDKTNICLSSTNEGSKSSAQVPAKILGEALTVSFNAQYLIDPLSVSNSEKVEFTWKDSRSPSTLSAENWLYIIMPVVL